MVYHREDIEYIGIVVSLIDIGKEELRLVVETHIEQALDKQEYHASLNSRREKQGRTIANTVTQMATEQRVTLGIDSHKCSDALLGTVRNERLATQHRSTHIAQMVGRVGTTLVERNECKAQGGEHNLHLAGVYALDERE